MQSQDEAGPVRPQKANAAAARLALQVRQLMWDQSARRAFHDAGVHLTRASFYSSIPSLAEVESSFEYAGDKAPYADSAVFDDAAMLAFLDELQPFADEFAPPREGSGDDPQGFFWGNPAFSFSDAMSYWAVLRRVQPSTVVEVGSGFSTLIAKAALERNGGGRLICVEPFPKAWLSRLGVELVAQPVQALDVDFFAARLADGDVLFIDSTHTVKTGSDCLHLYLRILPRLRRHLFLHAHDIFLPAGYPKQWVAEKDLHWTEQYLLLALLEGNRDFRVLFGSNYHLLRHRARLERFMGGKAAAGGGSFWFERVAPS